MSTQKSEGRMVSIKESNPGTNFILLKIKSGLFNFLLKIKTDTVEVGENLMTYISG